MITNLADLQAALLDGGVIDVDPTVTIEVDSPLSVGLPTWLRGGTFVCPTSPLFEIGTSDVTIEHVTAAGPGDAVSDNNQKLIYALGTQSAPLSGVRVKDCTLSGSRGINIWLEWCVDSAARGNAISDYIDSGVTVISGNRVDVSHNSISDGHLVPGGGVSVYGIAFTDLDPNTNPVAAEAARSRYCTAIGNRVHQIDWEGIDTHGGLGITVAGNTVTATRRSIALVTGAAGRLTVPTGCTVTGNAIDSTGCRVPADIGIFLAGIGASGASATVTGNTIRGYDGTGQQPISTITWDRTNTTVANNSRAHVAATPVTLTGGWTANSAFPPTFTVDGNSVTVDGDVIPPAGGILVANGHQVVGSLPVAAAWPPKRRFYAVTHGSNPAAGVGVLNVDTDGTLRLDYGNTSDQYSYPLSGTYQAI
ncbi:MAG TPA: right-handed parallel beta-helix repeat-containing protein [Pseudonocardiaceae bacterium]|nr:right-handed parallel beta-helix repeat-containing protein [Pseudonocardiaceae bacterium]